MSKFNVLFILGGPGAGKGTVCQKLVEKLCCKHLSAGDLLRQERDKPGSEHGLEIERIMLAGKIVPVAITCGLLRRAMEEAREKEKCNLFLIDGFPRNKDNLDGWEKEMNDKTEVKQVFYIDCSEENSIDRVLKRKENRTDDNEETLKRRINQFKTEGLPIIEHFKKQDLLTRIDANNSKEKVLETVLEAIASLKL